MEDKISKKLSLDDIIHDVDVDIKSMLLVKYPIPIVIVALYLAVIWYGIRWMRDRPAYQLKTILKIYNLGQIVYNMNFFFFCVKYPQSFSVFWKIQCKYGPEDIEMLAGQRDLTSAYHTCIWLFLVLKIIDLLDTIFMVLMKHNSHITFLHLYHHGAMVIFSWYCIKYAKAFQGIVPTGINIAVHIIMYTYYFLSTFGPSVQKYLWWKRYLTTLQMAQFVAVFLYISWLIYHDCSISRTFTLICQVNAAIFFCLFTMFYINTYRPKNKPLQVNKKDK